MTQSLSQKPVNTFVKGLITEASPLTFPENASVDELNCTLSRTGVRGRRKGIEFETDFVRSTFTTATDQLVQTLTWDNVSDQPNVEFLVVQHGTTIHFYDKSAVPISNGQKSFTIDLNTFSANNGKIIADHRVFGASVNGNLYLVSPAIETFFVTYTESTDSIVTTLIVPKVRDFEWQGVTSGYAENISTAIVTAERKYDTRNAGWVDEAAGFGVLDAYISARTAWPPITHPWYSGKSATFGTFDIAEWEKVSPGNSLIGNGHYILDLYSKDRSTASGVIGLPIETEATRFSTVAGFAGRVWFSGMSSSSNGSRVFFSPVVEGTSKVGNFYQEGDPTSENNPDLIDSDGGTILIPAASNIKALFEFGGSLLVFAENGVWEIKGVDEVFKAGSFAVSRVKNAGGLNNAAALVNGEGAPFWWGTTGIYTVGNEDVSQLTVGQDISKATVQTFFEDIPGDQRADAVGIFDELNKRVFWLYGNDTTNRYKFNRVLILDTLLQAFYPWSFSDESASTNYVVGMSYFSGLGSQEQTFDVVHNGDLVVHNGDQVQVTSLIPIVSEDVEIKFLVREGDTGNLTFARISNTGFLDWGTEDYRSFADAAYDFTGDLTTYKNGIYVVTYFDQTETGFTGNEFGGYNPVGASSCLLEAFWDLKNTASSSAQAYRLLRPVIVDKDNLDTFAYPYDSIVTRNRIRGRGRVLKLRFEGQTGKDFQLQGYEVTSAKNNGL